MLVIVMGKEMFIFDMKEGSDVLVEFIGFIGVDYFIVGDVYFEDYLRWVKFFVEKVGIKLFEFFWGRNIREFVEEMLEVGFKWVIIVVNKEKFGREWLGYIFCLVEDLEKFLEVNFSVILLGK